MKFRKLMLLFLSTSLLTGCQLSTSEEKETVPTKTTDKPVISIIADSEQSLALFMSEQQNIEKKFGVQLRYQYPSRLNDNLEDFIFASKETYDIYMIFPAKIPQYVEKDLLLPLDTYMEKTKDTNDILPVYRNLYMKFGNHDYGMVYDGDTHLLFYRKDIFKKYNDEYKKLYNKELKPPTTWEEYDQIAKFLTKDTNHDGKTDLYGTAIFGGDAKRYIWFAERFLSMGGKYFDENMNPLIQSDIGVEALQQLVNLTKSGATPPNSMYDWIDLNNAFLQGNLAMVVQWSDTSRFSFDQQTWRSKVANKVGWSLVPTANSNNPRGGIWIGRVLSISKQSAHADKAWDIISYTTSKEVSQKALSSKETINDPFRYSHFTNIDKGAFPTKEIHEDFLNTVQASLHHTNADLMISGSWEYMQILDENIHLSLIHKLTPEQALHKTADEWEHITEKYGRTQQAQQYKQWLEYVQEVSTNEKTQ